MLKNRRNRLWYLKRLSTLLSAMKRIKSKYYFSELKVESINCSTVRSNPQAPQAKPYGRNKNSNSIGPRMLGEKDHVSDYYISQAFRVFARAPLSTGGVLTQNILSKRRHAKREFVRRGCHGEFKISPRRFIWEPNEIVFHLRPSTTFISRGGIHLGAARDFFSLARPGVTFFAHLRCLKDFAFVYRHAGRLKTRNDFLTCLARRLF